MRQRIATGVVLAVLLTTHSLHAATAQGELEGRAAPVTRRQCIAGANAGNLCNENADCPGSSCTNTNIFDISVAIHFNASAAQLDVIRNTITAGSARLFDITDGQAQIGEVTLQNSAFGNTSGDLRVYPATQDTGWKANTGNWQVGGSIHVSINRMNGTGGSFGHEFIHLAFDARDEYEARPGCGGDDVLIDDTCPIQATIDAGNPACIMDNSSSSELCWGQGHADDPDDVADGDHDADNTTEQSQCRNNRSCWDQVVWSWPNTILMPDGAPDPNANGLVATPPTFTVVNNTGRGVLVLDESGSMSMESPSRMERLQVAAKDFVALAENGAELGLVSFATDAETGSGRSRINVTALGADRSALNNEIDSLGPATRTNISAGLRVAEDLITAAGGVTGNTFVLLMTDGLNNEPGTAAEAATELQETIDDLLDAGIEVFVTCTGGDVGLDSQCAEIATDTGGFYVDAESASDLPAAFAHIGAYTSGHELIATQGVARRMALRNVKSKRARALAERLLQTTPGETNKHVFFVEDDSESALFTLQWKNASGSVKAILTSPTGKTSEMRAMPQGLFARIPKPEVGLWTIQIVGGDTADYSAKAYSRNRTVNVAGGVRYATVQPGQDMVLYAYPRSHGRMLSAPGAGIPMLVTRPDGSTDLVVLHDRGRDKHGRGDDVAEDGTFTGVYSDTQQKGAYQFASLWSIDKWPEASDAKPHHHDGETEPHTHDRGDFRSRAFHRELLLTATVADPRDVDRKVDDPPPGKEDDPKCKDRVESWMTGGDPGKRAVAMTFDVQNASGKDLFFTVSPQSNDVAFEIMTPSGERKLTVPENRYCETPCPASGAPRLLDCQRPTPALQRVRSGANVKVAWSGMESVTIRRDCGNDGGTCSEHRPAKPGKYVAEVCAFPERSGGAIANGDRFRGETGSGRPVCRRVTFDYPSQQPVAVRFGR